MSKRKAVPHVWVVEWEYEYRDWRANMMHNTRREARSDRLNRKSPQFFRVRKYIRQEQK